MEVVKNQSVAAKLTHVAMEMWIPGNDFVRNAFPCQRTSNKHSQWLSPDYISSRAEKNGFPNLETRPLVRESAPRLQTRNCLTVIKSVRKPQMGALF
jgi:hypothetical protein